MATKATTKKAAPKKAAVKKATKTAALITFHETKSDHLAPLLGIDQARAKEIQAITRKAIDNNNDWKGSFEQLLTATSGNNELVYASFYLGAHIEQLSAHHRNRGANLLQFLMEIAAEEGGNCCATAPKVQVKGRPTRNNVQGQRKDGNGKR